MAQFTTSTAHDAAISSILKPAKTGDVNNMDKKLIARQLCFNEMQALESFEKVLQENILERRRRLNTFASILQLPTELLSNIFLLCCKAAPSQYQAHRRLEQVCTRWFEVMAGIPELRGCLYDLAPEIRTRRVINSIGNGPIDIYCNDWNTTLMDIAKSHVSQLRTLEISKFSRHRNPQDFNFVNNRAPLLESLVLPPTFISSPIKLFGGFTPRLRKLVTPDWNAPWGTEAGTPRLETIHVELPHELDGERGLQAFCRQLGSCSSLKEVHLTGFNLLYGVRLITTIINLPNLSSLTLEEVESDTLRLLLSNIRCPGSVDLKLKDLEWEYPGGVFTDLSDEGVLGKMFSSFAGFRVQDLRTSRGTWKITAITDMEPRASVTLQPMDLTTFDPLSFFHFLYSSYLRKNLEVLHLENCHWRRDLTSLHESMQEFVSVREVVLNLGKTLTTAILDTLGKRIPMAEPTGSTSRWIFPQLRTLRIKCMSLETESLLLFVQSRYDKTESSKAVLECPAPLECLDITSCILKPEMFGLVQKESLEYIAGVIGPEKFHSEGVETQECHDVILSLSDMVPWS